VRVQRSAVVGFFWQPIVGVDLFGQVDVVAFIHDRLVERGGGLSLTEIDHPDGQSHHEHQQGRQPNSVATPKPGGSIIDHDRMNDGGEHCATKRGVEIDDTAT